MKVAFCQISNQLINPEKDVYSEKVYNSTPGYKKGPDFWEVPLWIAQASNSIPDGELYIVRDIEQAIKEIAEFDVVMFSVLEVNKAIIKQIILNIPPEIKVIIGGYIDSAYFSMTGATWFDTLPGAIEYLGYEYNEGVSYKPFAGLPTLPRLSLSDGCLFKCAFCCVFKSIKEYSTENIYNQVASFKALDFELVYLNDKTFGQAKNHKILPELYKQIKAYNPGFKGFIIQTTATAFLTLDDAILACVAYVELGIESYNDNILKAMNKPHRTKHINDACERIMYLNAYAPKKNNIKLIPNIMVSLPGETKKTYQNTLSFLKANKNIISHINLYSLALYDNTPLEKELSHTEDDKNENSLNKSWSNEKIDTWFKAEALK